MFSLILFHGSPELPVTEIGKIRTALLLLGTPLLLLHRVDGFGHDWLLAAAYTILVVGCAGHVAAWAGYMRAAWRKYRAQRRAGLEGYRRG